MSVFHSPGAARHDQDGVKTRLTDRLRPHLCRTRTLLGYVTNGGSPDIDVNVLVWHELLHRRRLWGALATAIEADRHGVCSAPGQPAA